ncbi:MAG: outer membrane lipoprotein chaperone LolA [Proteobacteria bacterium]|nr:outer membrane lipoprotein chaperone LolA [Pseudomonadota bacterium]
MGHRVIRIWKSFLGSALLLFSLACPGSEAVGLLNTFFAEVSSFQGSFLQTVWSEDGKLVQAARGSVALSRPGRFRFQYAQPHRQLILADGKYLWVYDEQLQQAVARPIMEALGSAPIMLLMNARVLQDDFEIFSAPDRENLSWVELIPHVQDTEFHSVQIGLDEKGIRKMELHDQFSQKTVVEFKHLELNVSFPDGYFVFKAPQGVDVVGFPAK